MRDQIEGLSQVKSNNIYDSILKLKCFKNYSLGAAEDSPRLVRQREDSSARISWVLLEE